MYKISTALLLALTLTACVGGGGSSASTGSTGGGTDATSPALSFSPAKVTGTFAAGTAFPISVTATATRPADFNGVSNVYVLIVDDAGVIQADPTITAVSTTQYSVKVTTQTSLTAGTKTGNFSVRVCKDSACAAQFPGSPVALPYELVVTPKA